MRVRWHRGATKRREGRDTGEGDGWGAEYLDEVERRAVPQEVERADREAWQRARHLTPKEP